MKAFKGKFLKKDNTEREMTFCRIKDIPSEYVATKITGGGAEHKYPDGMELVLDLERDNFRVFNWKTLSLA